MRVIDVITFIPRLIYAAFLWAWWSIFSGGAAVAYAAKRGWTGTMRRLLAAPWLSEMQKNKILDQIASTQAMTLHHYASQRVLLNHDQIMEVNNLLTALPRHRVTLLSGTDEARTTLMHAAYNHQDALIRVSVQQCSLEERCALLRQVNANGNTFLLEVLTHPDRLRSEIFTRLLNGLSTVQARNFINVRNDRGLTALDLAMLNYPGIMPLLQAKGAITSAALRAQSIPEQPRPQPRPDQPRPQPRPQPSREPRRESAQTIFNYARARQVRRDQLADIENTLTTVPEPVALLSHADDQDDTTLMWAVYNNQIELIRVIVQQCSLEERCTLLGHINAHGNSVLLEALTNPGRVTPEIFTILLSGLSTDQALRFINIPNRNGFTALDRAAMHNPEIMPLLESRGAIHSQPFEHRQRLEHPVFFPFMVFFHFHGPDPIRHDEALEMQAMDELIVYAEAHNRLRDDHLDRVNRMLISYPDRRLALLMNRMDYAGTTLLEWAVTRNQVDFLRVIFNCTAEEKIALLGSIFSYHDGRTVLFSALLFSRSINSEVLAFLLNGLVASQVRDFINLTDAHGFTMLDRLAQYHVSIVSQLKELGAEHSFLFEQSHANSNASRITYAERLENINFDDQIPEEYICSITQEIMEDPVYNPTIDPVPEIRSHFERSAIEEALRYNPIDPTNRLPLTRLQLQPDPALKQSIENFVSAQEEGASKAQRLKSLRV